MYCLYHKIYMQFCCVFILVWLYYHSRFIPVRNLPVFFKVASLAAAGQSSDCPTASEATLKDMGKIHWYQTMTKPNKAETMFKKFGLYFWFIVQCHLCGIISLRFLLPNLCHFTWWQGFTKISYILWIIDWHRNVLLVRHERVKPDTRHLTSWSIPVFKAHSPPKALPPWLKTFIICTS